MLKNLKLLALASLCSAFLPSAVLADETNVTALPDVSAVQQPVEKSCEQRRREAEFFREMAKTDGDTNPQLPEIPDCKAEEQKAVNG